MRILKEKKTAILEAYYDYGLSLEQLQAISGMSKLSLETIIDSEESNKYKAEIGKLLKAR